MAGEKTLAFSIIIDGVSNENVEMQKLNIQLSNLNKEYKNLQRTIKDQGGLASGQQLQQLAVYTKEIDNHKSSIKELNKVMDSAPDSLKRMKAELDRAKEAANGCSGAIREKMSPYINKMTDDVKKAEQAMGTHTRGVGNYTNSIKNAVSQIFAIAAPAAAAAYALNGLKEAFLGTEKGAQLLMRVKLQMSAFFESIITGKWGYAFGNQLPKDIKAAADLMDKIRINDRENLVEIAKRETEIKLLRVDAVKAGKDSIEQKALLIAAEEKENELIKYKLDDKEEELKAVNMLLEKQKTNTDLLNKQAQLEAEIYNIKGEKSLRLATKLQAIEERQILASEKEKQKSLKDLEAMNQYTQEYFDKEEKRNQKSLEEKALMEKYTQEYFDKEEKRNQKSLEEKALMERYTQEYFDNEEKRKNVELKITQAHAQAKANIMNGSANLLNAIAGKNKALQKAGLIADKAVAIAEIIIQTKKANALLTAWGATFPPATTILAFAAKQANNLAAGINIAAVIAATVAGLAGFSKGGKINRGVPINTGTVDNKLIAVNNTETVLTQRHVAMLGGSGVMRRIGVPGYADGGYIGQQTPEISPAGPDFQSMVDAIRGLQITLDINKVRSANDELDIIVQTNRI